MRTATPLGDSHRQSSKEKKLKRSLRLLAAAALLVAAPMGAQATTTFQAVLGGIQEVPPNASPATGLATVVLNNSQDQITVDVSWTGLLAPASAGHIHGPAPVGSNAGVMFPLAGVSGTSGSIVTQQFAISPTQVNWLQQGLLYVNIHTSTFPGGEIRGQLTVVPEPSSLLSLAGCLPALGLLKLRRRSAR